MNAQRKCERVACLSMVTMAVLLVLTLPSPTQAQTFTVIHNFDSGAGGANPYAGVTIDRAGNLYGTTRNGGAGICGGCGIVYKLARSGSSAIITLRCCPPVHPKATVK